ncbi:hypothetical protein Clacol_010090 [Clathrus columnatus]|uniref:APC amino acid permease n=1 Tax=Clathrus columnatus TaxID=1419009 RepID=A0AAV5AMA1_9AGAM|nr:hypothetical protein Clacol_010090 [Clathrus columnatus]
MVFLESTSETDHLIASETDPLIGNGNASDGVSLTRNDETNGEVFDNVPQAKRQLGQSSLDNAEYHSLDILLQLYSLPCPSIYATPSNILRSSGSVGVAFIMWIAGALIAFCGTAVYMELGTGLPRSGGEKNYLEYTFRRPRYLVTCIFMVYLSIMGAGTANSVVFSEYLLHALAIEPTHFNTRLVAFLCLSFCCFLHGTCLKVGLRLQNTLGMFKLIVLVSIVISGILCLLNVPGFTVDNAYEIPHNFEWSKFWEGSGTGVNAFVSGLYNVIWSFIGYSNANYALSEVRDPVRTLKRAAPLAVFGVATMYILINVAYFAAVSKSDILGSQRIVAALFFRNLFGSTTERALSAFIALSTLGNLLAGQFSQGRVVQELGREGILPYAAFFASNKPFNAPLAGLSTMYAFGCFFLFTVPAGDAYIFLITLAAYSLTLINTFVSLGLLLLHTPAYKLWKWNPPFHAPKFVIMAFFISNLFLVVVPFIPPATGSRVYEQLPYWSHPVAAFSLSLIGIGYWYIWSIWRPKRFGYRLERKWVIQDDGVSRYTFLQVPL